MSGLTGQKGNLLEQNATDISQSVKKLSWGEFWCGLAVKVDLIKPIATSSESRGATKEFFGLVVSAVALEPGH